MGMIDMLRLRNIFGPPPMIGNDLPSQGGIMGNMMGEVNFPDTPLFGGAPPPIQPPMVPTSSPSMNIMARMRDLYTPQTEATDRYNELLSQYPEREPPSMLRRIGGGLMAAAGSFGPRGNVAFNPVGIKAGMEFMEQPFNDAVEDWQRRMLPTREAMINERNLNSQERMLATSALTQSRIADNDQLKNQLSQQANQIRLDIAEGKYTNSLELAKAKAEYERLLQELKGQQQSNLQNQKDMQIYNMKDPNDPTKEISVYWNPATKKYERVTLDGQGAGPVQTPARPGAGNTRQAANIAQIQQQARDTLTALDEMLDIKTDKNGNETITMKPEIADAVGPSRMLGLQYLPGTQTRKGNVAINHLKANMVLQIIGEMKAQSRTGATGFGALNLKELGVLEAAANKLDPGLDEKTFQEELIKIRKRLQMILQPENGVDETRTQRAPTFATPDEYIKFYSENP